MKKILLLLSALSLLTACSSRAPSSATDPVDKATPAPDTTPVPEPIIEAALAGNTPLIGQALAAGFEPDRRDEQGRTVLMYAAFNGHSAVIEKLLDAGADINAQDQTGSTALMFASSGPFPQTVQLLIERGAKVNTSDNNEHWTALMWAAAEGQADNVKLLLNNKADPTLKEADGDTAESFATQNGHTTVAQILHQFSVEGE
jgi:ankyrin repeat protein